jgi:lambda repressor-like predicted transcriptional regulator
MEGEAEETGEPGPLDDIADEDLIAEMQKRGLSLDSLESEPADTQDDQEQYI